MMPNPWFPMHLKCFAIVSLHHVFRPPPQADLFVVQAGARWGAAACPQGAGMTYAMPTCCQTLTAITPGASATLPGSAAPRCEMHVAHACHMHEADTAAWIWTGDV